MVYLQDGGNFFILDHIEITYLEELLSYSEPNMRDESLLCNTMIFEVVLHHSIIYPILNKTIVVL